MPTFDTPAPVCVVLSLAFGQVRVVASDRAETSVEVYPRDRYDQADMQAAEHLHVDCTDGRLVVDAAEPCGNDGAVIVIIHVPTGSSLRGQGMAADFLGVGELGACQLRTGMGHIRLDRTGSLQLTASLGTVTVGHATGTVEATADRGDTHLGQVEGTVTVHAKGEGDITVREAHGAARLHAEKGDVRVSRAHSCVDARTSHGDIHVGEVARESLVAATTFGSIRIGVARTSGARLFLESTAGTCYTSLSLLEACEQADEIVHIQARTGIGDIVAEHSGAATE
ncbi:DUF4097 family beta strand repeat-containing protein [Streptomyces sp. NPDC059002]|uniref:DUF4097 family beta strand repeat-containing protein n=1 Tax=Streptomyces sp. NPDC059002 TaxID=3346690 RepID=UPI0036ABF263